MGVSTWVCMHVCLQNVIVQHWGKVTTSVVGFSFSTRRVNSGHQNWQGPLQSHLTALHRFLVAFISLIQVSLFVSQIEFSEKKSRKYR